MNGSNILEKKNKNDSIDIISILMGRHLNFKMGKIILIFLAITTMANIKYVETKETPEKRHASCDFKEPGRIAQCAGELYDDGIINDEMFKNLLFKAGKKTGATVSTYYSVGYESGPHAALVAGTQTMYQFDSSARIPLNVHAISDTEYMLMPNGISDTALVYIVDGEVTAPKLTDGGLMYYNPVGHESQHVLYSSGTGGGKLEKGCGKYTENKAIRELEKRRFTSLVVPNDQWCPENVGHNHDIIIGGVKRESIDIGGSNGETYVFTWAMMVRYSDGNVIIRRTIGEAPEMDFSNFQ